MAIELLIDVMGFLDRAWRLVATGLAFVLFGLMALATPAFAGPWLGWRYPDRAQRQARARSLIHRSLRLYLHCLCWLGLISWKTHHAERLMRPGLLVLANHPSLLDVVFLMALIPRPDCIVKDRLFRNPLLRGYLHLTGFIANSDPLGLINDARASLASGSSLVIFPEGTRTDPNGSLHFQRGAANVALRTQTPITPVTIVFQPLALTKKHRWFHIPATRPRVTLIVGKDIPITDFNGQPLAVAARALTGHLQEHFIQELKAHEHTCDR